MAVVGGAVAELLVDIRLRFDEGQAARHGSLRIGVLFLIASAKPNGRGAGSLASARPRVVGLLEERDHDLLGLAEPLKELAEQGERGLGVVDEELVAVQADFSAGERKSREREYL